MDFPIPKLSLSEQWDCVSEVRDAMRQRVDAEQQEAEALKQTMAQIDGAYEGKDAEDKPKVYPTDYQGASPRQGAKALLGYRPKTKR